MINKKAKNEIRRKKHMRLRQRIRGTAAKPRLSVFRSNKHIYAQIIDDGAGRTLCSACTLDSDLKDLKYTDNVEAAAKVGEAIAKKALDKGISEVVFDRGGFIYHGKVAALAEAAREAGLGF